METLSLPIGRQGQQDQQDQEPGLRSEPAWMAKPLACRYCHVVLTLENARAVDIEVRNCVCKKCRVEVIDPEMAAVRKRLAPFLEGFTVENVRAIAESRTRGLIRLPVDLKDVGMAPAAPKCNLPDPGAEIEAQTARYRHRRKASKPKSGSEVESEDSGHDNGPANTF